MKFAGRFLCIGLLAASCVVAGPGSSARWTHLSTANGDLEVPNGGKEQTSSLVADFDLDGVNDFAVSERTQAPAVTWYRRGRAGWTRLVVEAGALHIEAGSSARDVDGDGDPDIVMAGDYENNRIWWWENPCPDFRPGAGWKRRLIKDSGGNKHHDLLFLDADGDFRPELAFWNQNDGNLCLAEIPPDPKAVEPWPFRVMYHYRQDSEMLQRGVYPPFRGNNEHEGLAAADIDGDGTNDIVGGGRWFKRLEDGTFAENLVDAGYAFSRAAAGQFAEGGRPEVLLVVGDGTAPMLMYEWREGTDEWHRGTGTWVPKVLVQEVENGHSLSALDVDGDGHLDLWNAEMRLNGGNPDAKNRILYGDGKGGFREEIVSEGFGLHESKIVDLDGDGDLDILGKPYNWETPRLDVWLQDGTGPAESLRKGSFSGTAGLQLYSLRYEFKKDVPGTVKKVREMGFRSVEVSDTYGLAPRAFRDLLRANGLESPVLLFGYDRFVGDLDGIAAEAGLFGAGAVGCGWIPHAFGRFTRADLVKAIADFNAAGRALRAKGLTFFYHLHGYEFGSDAEGPFIDALMAGTDPDAVSFELDAFWVRITGTDPVRLMRKHPGRFALLHLKDLRTGTPVSITGGAPDETSVPLGRGVVDFPALFREAKRQKVRFYFIEDEAREAVDQVPESLRFLKSLN